MKKKIIYSAIAMCGLLLCSSIWAVTVSYTVHAAPPSYPNTYAYVINKTDEPVYFTWALDTTMLTIDKQTIDANSSKWIEYGGNNASTGYNFIHVMNNNTPYATMKCWGGSNNNNLNIETENGWTVTKDTCDENIAECQGVTIDITAGYSYFKDFDYSAQIVISDPTPAPTDSPVYSGQYVLSNNLGSERPLEIWYYPAEGYIYLVDTNEKQPVTYYYYTALCKINCNGNIGTEIGNSCIVVNSQQIQYPNFPDLNSDWSTTPPWL